MPKLKLVGQNVCGFRSPFCLVAYIAKKSELVAPDGHVLVELDAKLEPVMRIECPGVDPGERFVYELEIDAIDLSLAQWAPSPEVRDRFQLDTLRWGDLDLLEQPGII